jgi:hypothetical protein
MVASRTEAIRTMVRQFLNQAGNISRSRSSVLTPLQWTFGMFLAGSVLFVLVRAPAWMTTTLFVGTLVFGGAILAAYGYFAWKNPSDLRSERYALIHTALNRNLQGDSLHDLKDLIDITDPRQIERIDDKKQLGPGNE